MAWRQFGAKPLTEPMLVYCSLDSWEQISVKLESEFYYFHSRKCIWNCCLPFCQGTDELSKTKQAVMVWANANHVINNTVWCQWISRALNNHFVKILRSALYWKFPCILWENCQYNGPPGCCWNVYMAQQYQGNILCKYHSVCGTIITIDSPTIVTSSL